MKTAQNRMESVEIPGEIKIDLESNQNQLKNAICNHQSFLNKLKADPNNTELQNQIRKAEQDIILIGLAQKRLLQSLREENKVNQKSTKAVPCKTTIEERRFNLSNALNRARKQNMISRSGSVTSASDDSIEGNSLSSPPEPKYHPIEPQDLPQTEFLQYFGLITHDVCRELQNRRVERKRRSTANPHFLYGNKGWEFPTRRKRNAYLYGAFSPPNTRQAVKKRNNERVSPTLTNGNGKTFTTFPAIPNLPSGLTIERVSPSSSSPDSKCCITCRQPGSLIVCEVCTNGFHVGCHNRPLTQQPRQCPRCITKEVRTIGALNVPSGMSVSYVNPSEVSEKLEQKVKLQKQNQNLTAELTQLQDKHSQMTISLKNQKSQQEELLTTQQSTEAKIKQILDFITTVKNSNFTKD